MNTINLGLRAHDYGQGMPAEIAAEIGRFPVSCVQLALAKSFPFITDSPGQITPGFANHVRDEFARYNINIAVLGCYINPIHPDPAERERSLRRFEEHLQFARDFGCSIVGTETGSRNADCTYHPDNHSEAAFQELVVSVRRLADVAERHGVFVGIEGVAHHHTINTYDRMERLLMCVDSPNVKVIYDPVNFFPLDECDAQQQLMDEAFTRFGDHIVAIHCKDFVNENGVKTGDLPSGSGEMDHAHLFGLIQKNMPFVHVILESTDQKSVTGILKLLNKAAMA
ncbi:MAG: sugar phosphate isomerase/epimerase [Alteromonadaceae bacterium]|nr:sugar phosphate isomerase/epimerase [Alteromonadaceae bacterium]